MITAMLAVAIVLVVVLAHQRGRQRDLRPRQVIADPARVRAASAAAAAAHRTDPALSDVCRAVRHDSGWDMAFVTIASADRVLAVGRDGMPDGPLTDAGTADSVCATVVAGRHPIVVTRRDLTSALLGGCMAGRTLGAYVGVPIYVRDQVVGALAVSNFRRTHTAGLAAQDTVRVLLTHAASVERHLAAGDRIA